MNKKMSPDFECDFCSSPCYEERPHAARRLGLSSTRFKIVECTVCGLTTLFPQPSGEELANFYQNYASKKNRIQDELSRMKTIYPAKLKKLSQLAKGTKLLDIGAGLGAFCHLAELKGFEVTGVELSAEQCRYARQQFNLNLVNRDIFSAGKEFGPYDVIHLHHVMEHLTSPNKVFKKIRHLLKPEGILLLEVPYQLPQIQERIRKQGRSALAFDYDHLYFFTPRTMKNYICGHGFKIKTFSQHRPVVWQTNRLPWQAARYLFKKITSALYLPSGPFLEFYCQRKPD